MKNNFTDASYKMWEIGTDKARVKQKSKHYKGKRFSILNTSDKQRIQKIKQASLGY